MMLKHFSINKMANWELPFITGLFIFLWIYLIIRANTVFFFHDEIVTKWAYMVLWNPLPYHGYIDANNHFLNSFFGGLFIRLFHSDAMWIVRLPNILVFPVFFWAIVGLYNFFEKKINFYTLLISLTCSTFIIEFFGFARGYGISIAFLILALQQTLIFFKKEKIKNFIFAIFSWLFAVYSNLTLIPFVLAGFIYLTIFLWQKKHRKWIIIIFLSLFPLVYLIKYSFYLKQAGKLYLGAKEGFFVTTIHSLTPYLWNIKSSFVDILLTILALFMLFTVVWSFSKTKKIFDPKMMFPVFFLLGIFNILFQNWILEVNFPEDRAALYLVIFFYGGLSFTIDYWKNEWIAYLLIALSLVFFGLHYNFNHSILAYSEHHDKELLTKIPSKIKGMPPSLEGQYYQIENEFIRSKKLHSGAFYEAPVPIDTMADYIIIRGAEYPELINLYHIIHKDKISGLDLFERNTFLLRKKIEEKTLQINGTKRYFNLYVTPMKNPLFFRCSGTIENVSIFEEIFLVFSAKNDTSSQDVFNRYFPITKYYNIDETGNINFDFTFNINYFSEANQIKVYVWNKGQIKLKGKFKLEVFDFF